MKLTVDEICALTGGKRIMGEGSRVVRHACVDSRAVTDGDLFVPIVGNKVDAHRFIASAFEKGAAASFTMDHESAEDLINDPVFEGYFSSREATVIFVEDTLKALQKLAQVYRRDYVHIPLVAVTGSVGKTTTREMTAAALGAGKRVFRTEGNQNSQVGLPIQILNIDENLYDVAVLELGMSMPGEMTALSKIAAPDLAVITNIGDAHLAQMGSYENTLIEKLHILDGASGRVKLFLNGDDLRLKGLDEEAIHRKGINPGLEIEVEFFGKGENCTVRAEEIRTDEQGMASFMAVTGGKSTDTVSPGENAGTDRCPVKLSAAGEHMVQDAVCALAVASALGVKMPAAAEALSGYKSMRGRGQLVRLSDILLIDDTYNASPDSMKAGLKLIDGLPAPGKKIAVLADMLELGGQENRIHAELGRFIVNELQGIDLVLTLGNLAKGIETVVNAAGRKTEAVHFDSIDELTSYFIRNVQPGDAVYVKGSNSMGLDRLVQAFRKEFTSKS